VSALEPAAVVAERALASARGECIVLVEEEFSANVRFAMNTTTTNGVTRDRTVTVIAIAERAGGRSVGVARRSGGGDVVELLRSAEAIADAAPPAEDDAALLVGESDADFDAAPAESGFEGVGVLLSDLGSIFERARAEGRRLAGFAEHDLSTLYLATSSGLRRRHVQSTGSLELVARSLDGSRSSWLARGGAALGELSLASLDEELARRLSWAARRIDLDAGRYEVLLPPEAVADLVLELAWAMSGRDAEDGGSCFSRERGTTALGERLSPLPFRLHCDPNYPGLECTPFLATGSSSSDVSVFDNGAPLEPIAFIDEGRLARLAYHRAGAARSGAAFTPPVDNLVLDCPGASGGLSELIASTERALLLTCLWYIREVDPVQLLLTGLTRDGVYLVEHGEIVGAVNNFRFNESPLDLLAHALEVGETQRTLSREWGEYANRTAMPPLRVEQFNMSSVSPAS
jgi:predicted Zn-dependent protease